MRAARRVFTGALLGALVLQAVTGWVLATVYAPTTQAAWASVVFVQYKMAGGALVRGLHHFGSHVTVAAAFGLIAVWIAGAAYRGPRARLWLGVLGAVGLVLAFTITGNALPWDEGGFGGAATEMGVIGLVPLVGPWLARIVQGGSELGQLGLTRLYALHVSILPAAAGGLGLWLFVARRRLDAAEGTDAATAKRTERAWWTGSALAMVVVVYALTSIFGGAPIDAPAGSGEAFPARPEWYFRPLNMLLSLVGPTGQRVLAAFAPLVIAGVLASLPRLDREGTGKRRIAPLAPALLVGLGGAILLAMSLRRDGKDEEYRTAVEVANERRDHAVALAMGGVPADGPLAMLRNDPTSRAGWLFDQHCGKCHRFAGRGPSPEEATAPDLTGFGSPAWAEEMLRDPDGPTRFGKTPFAGMMPSMTKPPADPEEAAAFTAMSDADVAAVTAFLAAQAKGERAEGTPGEKIVKERCTSCHRLDGATDDDEALGPELRGWASVAWIEAQIDDPESGKAYPKGSRDPKLEGHMPAFHDDIAEADRKLLATWLRREP